MKVCVGFIVSIVNSPIFVGSIFADFDCLALCLLESSTTTSVNMTTAKTRKKAREIAESTVFSLESGITIMLYTSPFLSKSNSVVAIVVWSLVVK